MPHSNYDQQYNQVCDSVSSKKEAFSILCTKSHHTHSTFLHYRSFCRQILEIITQFVNVTHPMESMNQNVNDPNHKFNY